MNILEEAKEGLLHDFSSPKEEWEFLNSLGGTESERLVLLKWVFLESSAYWETRAKAGQILLDSNEVETWAIIEKLVASFDPDDNGTALTLFEALDNPRTWQMAQRWLAEEANPFTQLEAIDYVGHRYSKQAQSRLQALLKHPNPLVRQRARDSAWFKNLKS